MKITQLDPEVIIELIEASVFDLKLFPAERRLFTINYNEAITMEDKEAEERDFTVCPRCGGLGQIDKMQRFRA